MKECDFYIKLAQKANSHPNKMHLTSPYMVLIDVRLHNDYEDASIKIPNQSLK